MRQHAGLCLIAVGLVLTMTPKARAGDEIFTTIDVPGATNLLPTDSERQLAAVVLGPSALTARLQTVRELPRQDSRIVSVPRDNGNTSSGGFERNDEGERAATAKEHCTLKTA